MIIFILQNISIQMKLPPPPNGRMTRQQELIRAGNRAINLKTFIRKIKSASQTKHGAHINIHQRAPCHSREEQHRIESLTVHRNNHITLAWRGARDSYSCPTLLVNCLPSSRLSHRERAAFKTKSTRGF